MVRPPITDENYLDLETDNEMIAKVHLVDKLNLL